VRKIFEIKEFEELENGMDLIRHKITSKAVDMPLETFLAYSFSY